MWGQILQAGLIGASALGGILGNKAKSTTQKTTASNQASGTTGSSQQRILTEEQQAALAGISGYGTARLADPGSILDPLRRAAIGRVNASFTGLEPALKAKTTPTYGGMSGKLGGALRQSEIARYGKIADVNAEYDERTLSEQRAAAEFLMQILGMQMGQTSFGDYTQTGSSTSETVGTTPSNMLGGGFGAGLETAGLLAMLNNWFGKKGQG